MWRPSVAIIGTRDPDSLQVKAAELLSFKLSTHYDCDIWTGGADGIDHAAMTACAPGHLYVCTPWHGYNEELIPSHAKVHVYHRAIHEEWGKSVRKYHPKAAGLTSGSFKLHARNFGIVKGRDLVAAFPNQDGQGGTGQGMRIAQALGIPLLVRKCLEEYSLEELLLQALHGSKIVPF